MKKLTSSPTLNFLTLFNTFLTTITLILLLDSRHVNNILQERLNKAESNVEDKGERISKTELIENEVKDINSNDYPKVSKATDCPILYTSNENDIVKRFGDIEVISQVLPNRNNPFLQGSCVYIKKQGAYMRIYGNPSWKGFTIHALLKDHLLLGQGCGTECYGIYLINLEDKTGEVITGTPYFKISNNDRWLVSCRRQIYIGEKLDEESFYRTDPYMCTAIDLMNFRKYKFASNPYYNSQDFGSFDFKAFSMYWLDIDFDSYNTSLLTVSNDTVTIPFIDKSTNEKELRTFNIDQSFKETKVN
jgi:hypothetical protein